MSGVFSLPRAAEWLLRSGIQDVSGGVARYYRADTGAYKPISTEITGYVASAYAFLFRITGNEIWRERARITAGFLCAHAWDEPLQLFPFEHPSPSAASEHHSYFFDCGIIIRGLMAVWRIARDDRFLDTALAASRGMMDDFHSGSDYHPILSLPGKEPLARTDHWSRSPGCYQLKSALAWWEVAQETGEEELREAYFEILEEALRSHRAFLPGAYDRTRIMDRLHAYSYFLEGIWPALDRPDCVEAYRCGLDAVAYYLREIAPEFARSDVYAQLLRARIYGANAIAVDVAAAREEAAALAGFQSDSADPHVAGSFLFGRRDGVPIPHANPVSTVFAVQALEAWRAFEAGEANPCPTFPI